MMLPELSDESCADSARPRVWVLADDRPGHRTQVIGLAEALDWPYEIKELRFNALNRLSNRLLGASLLGLDRGRSTTLAPPWPDLVIAMGRRCAPVARWIGKHGGGEVRLVQLGRKGANVAAPFDLAITCAHFQLPAHPRRLETLLPLTQVTPGRLNEAAQRWGGLFREQPKPWLVLLVGGTTAHHRLSPDTARAMARQAASFAAENGGSLTIVTSRRTGAAATTALSEGAPQAQLHAWRRDRRDNPYLGYLALADALIVTGESESMLAEAAATGKPLYICPIPERPAGWRGRFAGAVLRTAKRGERRLAGRVCSGLIESGAVVPPRDLGQLHRALVETGRARYLGDPLVTTLPQRTSEHEEVLRRIRALMTLRDPAEAA